MGTRVESLLSCYFKSERNDYMKLPYKVEFVGRDNLIAVDVINGKRRKIAQFDNKGLFVTNDAETAVRLEKKGFPYHEYKEKKKGKTSPKTENVKEEKDEKDPFD